MESELRYNVINGEWVLMAPKRGSAKKPHDISSTKNRRQTPKDTCPFENLEKSGNLPPYFQYPQKGRWNVLVFPNKFPGVTDRSKKHILRNNFYMALSGYGYHDLLITREHGKNFSDLPNENVFEAFCALRKRYTQVSGDGRIDYVSIFQNWGASVGASLFHPHMQIIALPVLPSHIAHELTYAQRYAKHHGGCVYCDMIRAERKEKKRIVYENKEMIAFVPYAAQEPYEVLILPKKHHGFFERSSDVLLKNTADAYRRVLKTIKKRLQDPDYNMYIHTAPATDGGAYPYMHWYLRIIPKSNLDGGLELGTGVQMNPLFPEDTARILKIKKTA